MNEFEVALNQKGFATLISFTRQYGFETSTIIEAQEYEN